MKREHFAGMTLNERLGVAGLLDAFDAAARERNRARMTDLLEQVVLDSESAADFVDTILADPARYGF